MEKKNRNHERGAHQPTDKKELIDLHRTGNEIEYRTTLAAQTDKFRIYYYVTLRFSTDEYHRY